MSEILQNCSSDQGLVLLYHAVFENLPEELDGSLHNVTPNQLRLQLQAVARRFEFVSVDDFSRLENPAGFAAVSFDDGYRCVLEQALPIFEELKIPFTLYVNGGAFDGSANWRDKIRYLESRDLTKKFESEMRGITPVAGKRFYRYSKSALNNSQVVDKELDRFLSCLDLLPTLSEFLLSNLNELPVHPLIHYGNHSHNHYVLSSLNSSEIERQIRLTHGLLSDLPDKQISRWFSVPFGDLCDFDSRTSGIIRKLGYAGCLLSRYRSHHRELEVHGAPAIERLMPR
ncbi:MAG: peptidoglycan/xylan/chitin deacetylase (PgdA/CDA1 family) [Parasphingorhabdus sp.]|jgi:peptidoglycan/xylan/chitin deacetylase (PgdA/CDA1 family)